MAEAGEVGTRMLPLWVQWFFVIGGITLIVVVFAALWSRLGKIQKRIGRLEGRFDNIAPQKEAPAP